MKTRYKILICLILIALAIFFIANRSPSLVKNVLKKGHSQSKKYYKSPELKLPKDIRATTSFAKKEPQKLGQLKVAVVKLQNVSTDEPLISNGIPFAPGQLQSERDFALFNLNEEEIPIAVKVLARWPLDQSIRSVLVQFKYPIEHKYNYLFFKWGVSRQTKDLTIVPAPSDYPQGMILLPAEWLCASEVLGEQVPFGQHAAVKYDNNLEENFNNYKDSIWTGDVIKDNFYDTVHSFYQFFIRTGDIKYFQAARKELLHYRDTQIVHDGEDKGGSYNGRLMFVYVEAMLDDYLLTGDERSKEVALEMAEYLYKVYPPERVFFPKNGDRFWTERNAAFAFLGIVKYYEFSLDPKFLKLADEYMQNLYKTQLEWPTRGGFIHNLYAHDPEEGAKPGEYGGSPFMTGLLLEAVVRYHQLTQSKIAADSIFRAVDWLIKEALVPSGDSFKYTTAQVYLDSSGEPDLNLLLVHAFGYAFRLSGYQDRRYLDIGMKVFERGVNQGYLADRKHFNQNYRSSGHFLAYIKDGLKSVNQEVQTLVGQENLAINKTLYSEDFEFSLGRFKARADTDIELDKENVYESATSLKIKSKFDGSELTAGIQLDNWNVNQFPLIELSYRIPPGVPVGLEAKTQFGDWLCLGGTASFTSDRIKTIKSINLVDDNNWHTLSIDIAELVHSKLPQLKNLTELQFSSAGSALKSHDFWIDDFKIMAGELPEVVPASKETSDSER